MMKEQRMHLKSYFGFSKLPFTKYMWASKMFDAKAQQSWGTLFHISI